MTVCVSVKVNDCIVFAADSAMTLSNSGQVLNVYNNGDKVFNLHRKCPIAGMFCGMGSIGDRSISNLSKELRVELMRGESPINPDDYTVQAFAERTHAFFAGKYSHMTADPSHDMEYYVGGYGSAATHGEVWRFRIVAGVVHPPEMLRSEGDHGINWGGQITPIARLLSGVDPALVPVLVNGGLDAGLAQAIYQTAQSKLMTPLYASAMPTADVIRLAQFLADLTKGYFSFAEGSDIVGGPTDIAAVTKWEGFRWIQRKHYYPRDLNTEDHGHAC